MRITMRMMLIADKFSLYPHIRGFALSSVYLYAGSYLTFCESSGILLAVAWGCSRCRFEKPTLLEVCNATVKQAASFVVAVTQWGLTLVMEPSKPPPWLWKIAGGAGEGDETPEQTAVREYCEEVGGEITEEDLVLIKVEQHRIHTRYFYRVDKREVNPKKRGDEGGDYRDLPAASRGGALA